MSAIAGIVGHDREPAQGMVDAMLSAMSRRLGGGAASKATPEAVLGSGRLRPLPDDGVSLGPRSIGPYLLAADIRIDNRDELASRFGPADDTALLLAAYDRWGEDCLDHLVGDFAFALWDRREQRLFCARDHFGVRPFYYALEDGRMVFASEIKGVLTGLRRPPEADARRLADFLVGAPQPESATEYLGVNRLPAASALRFAAGQAHIRRYWVLTPGQPQARSDAPDVFRSLFKEAVSCRMQAAEAPGAMLSGGLDSSSIACVMSDLARESGQGPTPTVSLVFDNAPKWSERREVETVLARGGFAPVFVGPESPFSDFDTLLEEQQGLIHAPALGTSRRIAAAAAAQKLDVVLDGFGGDEVVSYGVGRLKELAKAKRWGSLWRECRGVAGIYGRSTTELFSTYVFLFARGAHLRRRLAQRLMVRRLTGQSTPPLLATTPFAEATGLAERLVERRVPTANDEQGQHLQTLTSGHQTHALEVLDRTAGAQGLEGRYPFWDKRLVEFCLSLQSHEKLDEGWTRLILRRGMEGVLPPSIQWRRDKMDFTPHLALGMLGPDRPLVESMIVGDEADMSAYVSLPLLRAAYARLRARRERANGTDVQTVWRGVAFALWLRKSRSDGVGIA